MAYKSHPNAGGFCVCNLLPRMRCLLQFLFTIATQNTRVKSLSMGPPESKIDEKSRLAALESYGILDTLPEQIYEDVTALASLICGTPIALISLVAADRQWFKSEFGQTSRESPRSQSFCAHTLETRQTLIVKDTTQDDRFKDNPLVLGYPSIRFYAGAPIVDGQGHVLGTVCVIDTVSKGLSAIQVAALEALARQVMAMMDMRRTIARYTGKQSAGAVPETG